MATKLSGLQIQKLLPKTNCKECGSNTCLAFAMKLAAQKAELSECPYASEEAKAILGAAAEPPVASILLGPGKTLKLGDETVLYRHEKTFANRTLLAVNVNDTDAPADRDRILTSIRDYVLERVGETLAVEFVAVTQRGKDRDAFANLAKQALDTAGRPVLLRSADPAALAAAAAKVKGSRSVIVAPSPEAARELRAVAVENNLAMSVTAPDLDGLVKLTTELRDGGFKDILLQFQAHSLAEQFQTNTVARRAAIKGAYKPLGYATVCFVEGGDRLTETAAAVNEICKYGGICVLPSFDPAQLAALMTLRLNIYTDPQKPIQVEPKLYPIGEATAGSPVFVTTNFSLTYFIVSGEIENSGASAWLLVPECEGMSVLTAWAAGKFSGASIAKFAREIELDKQVQCRDMIIPGYVAQISGELEESMPGWNIIVGPQEAADLESFVKARLKSA